MRNPNKFSEDQIRVMAGSSNSSATAVVAIIAIVVLLLGFFWFFGNRSPGEQPDLEINATVPAPAGE